MRALVCALCVLALPGLASAKSTRELPYGAERVWPVLVRFLRVDEKLKITEKDEGAGYVLFELADGKRTFHGAAELARITDGAGRSAVRITLRLEDRPSYMEDGILDRLQVKVHDELGDPAPAPPSRPATPPPASDAPPEDRKQEGRP